MTRPDVRGFFDAVTNTVTYVVADPVTSRAAIVDPVLDFDAASGRTRTHSADAVMAYVRDRGLDVDWILETHVHADHLSAAPYLKAALGGVIGIGEHVLEVQQTFRKIFNLEALAVDGRQFGKLFTDGEHFRIGDLEARVMHTPGHTPACVTYVVGDAAFVGDTLFMPDYGTARADFPGGDAGRLYDSIHAILALPDDTRLFLCHDYKAPGRDDYAWETTVAAQRSANVHVRDGIDRASFVAMREDRDSRLGMPQLILPSIQVNVRAGEFPPAEDNGVSYLKLPLNLL
jgi:glyoxylase-like metal-dependent hydrolase (beta-lactamase superfamily II)